MTPMNPEVKKKWIGALTSGEYKQTENRLRDEGGFCCWGVLCDLHSKETGIPWEGGGVVYLGHFSVPPENVLDWAGIDERGGVVRTLYHKNDDGIGFPEIALWIEENL